MLGIDQRKLAELSGLSTETIRRIEKVAGPVTWGRTETILKIQRALEAAGVEFTNGDQPGVRLKAKPNGPVSIPPEELNASNDE
jgi:transcriptional regulator with XRE-family HTH domain